MGGESELIVGLDVGTSKVAVVVAEKGGASQLHVVGVGTAPSEGLRKGVVIQIDATVQAIEEAIKEAEVTAGCEIHTVVADVSGAHVRGFNSHGVAPVRNDEVDHSDVDRVLDAARAIGLPADRDILHVLPQDFVLDGQNDIRNPVGMSGVRLEARVHVVTTHSASAHNVIKCCQRAGLHVADLVLEPLAAAEAVLTSEERDLGVALIDLGAGTTDVLIFHQGALKHTAILSLGGNHVTSDVAAGLRIPLREAELLKQRSGSALARAVGRDQSVEVSGAGGRNPRLVSRQLLAEIIEARAEELLTLARHQVVKCGLDECLGSGVVLTGGTALLPGLASLAEGIFQTPVRIGVPIDCDGESSGILDSICSPAFAAAVGLARYGANPRDYLPSRRSESGRFDWMRKRFANWLESFF